MEENDCSNGPLDGTISIEEINHQLKLLKNGKACGPDLILNEMLKQGGTHILPSLQKIFNSVLKSGSFPTAWSSDHLTVLHKKGSRKDPNNYRGISLSSCLGKLFTRILNARLSGHLEDNNVIPPEQGGFRKNFRTADNMFILKSLIDKYKYVNKTGLFTCFVDFSKAFDSVWRPGLLFKLMKNNVTGNMYKIIKSMLSNSSSQLKLGEGLLPPIKPSKGVRQGCSLSPTLFNLFISDLPSFLLENSKVSVELQQYLLSCLLWADDLVLFSSSSSGLNKIIDSLRVYCERWNLNVNYDKTKVVEFKNSYLRKDHFDQKYFFGCKEIHKTDSYTYLGISFHKSGKCSFSAADIVNKAKKAIFKLKNELPIPFHQNVQLSLKLFDSMIAPILTYGCEMWGFESTKQSNCIDIFHQKFCREVLGVSKKSANLGVLGELGRYPMKIQILSSIVKFCCHVQETGQSNPLLNAAFSSSISLIDLLPKSSWINSLRKTLNQSGYGNLWLNLTNSLGLTQREINLYTLRLKDNFQQQWFSDLFNDERKNKAQKNKLRLYRKFKTTFEMSEYLSNSDIPVLDRIHLTKFRISNHKLLIETGRYTGKPVNERLCPSCNEIDTECHFLFQCKIIPDRLRKKLFDLPLLSSIYADHPVETKFIKVMSIVNPCVQSMLASFISKGFKIRGIDLGYIPKYF